jgi:hypothetical protein
MSKQQEFTLGPFYGELAARAAEARGHLTGARLGAQGVRRSSGGPCGQPAGQLGSGD